MFPYVRKPANLFLSLVMAFEVMFPVHLFAQTAPETEVYQTPAEVAESANELSSMIENSRRTAAGLPKNAFAPDRFLLLEQQAFPRSYVGRTFSIAKNRREREIEKHLSRVDRVSHLLEQAVGLGAPALPDACVPFADDADLNAKKIEEGVVFHLNEGRKKDTPLFVWKEKNDPARAACVREILTNLRDAWKLQVENEAAITDLSQDVPNMTKAPAVDVEPHYNWWEVRVDAVAADEHIESVMMSRSADYTDMSRSGSIVCKEPCSFDLTARGLKINSFKLKVKTLTTFGPYVVFTHEDSYDETTGIQYVSFLDLKSYGNLLGKEEIPVFTIPITEFEGRIESLGVINKTLVMNSTHTLPLKKLIEASEGQRAVFNIAANLLDVNEMASMMPYVESIDSYMNKVVSTELAQARSAADDSKVAQIDFKEMGKKAQEQLEQSKSLSKLSTGKPADLTKEEFANLPTEMHALLDNYSTQLAQSQSLKKAMSDSNLLQQRKRGLTARVKALYHRVMTPVPNASLKVKRALIMVGAQQNVDQNKFINQLVDRPWLVSAVTAAVVVGAVSPETYDMMQEGSLAVVNGLADYIKYAVTGIGLAAVEGTVATAKPVYSMLAPLYTWGQEGGTLYDTYIANGNWEKTAIGTGAFTAFIGMIWFVPHVIFNVHNVLYDRKMAKQEGKWEGFVAHQKKFVESYLQRLSDEEAVKRKMKKAADDKLTFTEEEDAEALAWIAARKAERKPPGFVSRLATNTKQGFVKLAELPRQMFENGQKSVIVGKWMGVWEHTKQVMFTAATKTAAALEPVTKPVDAAVKKLAGPIGRPLAHVARELKDASANQREVLAATSTLAFSGPAMELTLSRWAGGWNWFSGGRYTIAGWGTLRDLGLKYDIPFFVRPKPISIAVRLFLPNFFHTVVSRRGPAVTLPTSLNGGIRTWERRDLTWYKEKVFGRAPMRGDLAKMSKPEIETSIVPESDDDTIATRDTQLSGILSPEMAGNVAEDAVEDATVKEAPASPISDESVANALEAQYLDDVVTDSESREVKAEVDRALNASELKAIRENFEDAILPVEDAIFKAAFDESLSRMADFLGNKKDLVNLFASAPIHSVIEKRVREMPVKVRTFLRLYTDRVYDATMKEYLKEAVAAEAGGDMDLSDLGDNPKLTALKRQLIATRTETLTMKPFQFDAEKAGAIAHRIARSEGFYETIRDQAKKGELSIENWKVNRKYNLVADYDPSQNKSMARYADVQKRLKSPTALARAVRSEISKLIVTFPLDLGFKLLFAAAIYEGAFKPLQDSMWGENSAFYFSWTSFYYSMGMSFTIGMMADAWNKLQVDARQDNLGDFGAVPQGEDAEKGFLRWYGKQWSARNNSVMANWKHSNSLVFWNIPAFMVNVGAFSLLFSGRIDLSYMFAGFPITFGTPWGAFNQKIDQTFERAAEYPARGIPNEKYMSHPQVQAYLSSEKQSLRNKFQWMNDLYGNVAGSWQGNIMFIPTSMGPRGFTRAMLGGYLLEELIVNKVLQPINHAASSIPVIGHGVNAVTSLCEQILTNGNPDLTKLKK